jgi:hypothetical protein
MQSQADWFMMPVPPHAACRPVANTSAPRTARCFTVDGGAASMFPNPNPYFWRSHVMGCLYTQVCTAQGGALPEHSGRGAAYGGGVAGAAHAWGVRQQQILQVSIRLLSRVAGRAT